MAGHRRLATYFAAGIGLIFLVAAPLVVFLVNNDMKRQALAEAESKARLLLDMNLAVHTYFSKDLKPKLFDEIAPLKSKEYFDPIWMSSTYAVREIDKYFQHFNTEPYYYKEAAINARSPQNEADAFEKQFLQNLAGNEKLTQRVAIRAFDGKPFFTVLRRGEMMEESCLRCHSTPDRAPGDLVKHYDAERSFNRNIGEVAQAISMRIPLAAAYGRANLFSLHLSGALIGILLASFLLFAALGRRYFLNPLAEIRDQATLIATHPEHLGRTITDPTGKELQELVAAFNAMSLSLKLNRDLLDQRVCERTAELEQAKAELEREISERKQAEKALKESEVRYRTFFETAGDAIYVLEAEGDRAGQILSANRAAAEMHGYTTEELLTLRISDLDTPESAAKVPLRIERLLKGERLREEVTHGKKDGTVFTMEINAQLLELEDHKYIMAIDRDITERKRAEEALKDSEERYRHLVEVSPDGIAVQQDGRLVFVNPSGARMLGAESPDNLLGKHISEILHPDNWEAARNRIQRMMNGETGLYPVEHRYVKLDGSAVPVEVIAAPFEYAGKPAVQVVARDITERKRAQKALQESEERFRILAEGAFEGVVISRDGTILDSNEVFCRLSGYGLQELVGMNIQHLVAPEFGDITMKYVLSGSEETYESALVCKDGRVISVQVKGKSIPYEGGSARIASVRDITAARKSEEVQKRLATAIEQAAEAVLITDTEGIIQYVNPALERITGFRSEELYGKTPRVFKSGEHEATFYGELWETLKAGNIWSGRFVNKRKDGKLFHEEATISPVRSASGEITNFVAVKRDITEHLELSKQLYQAQKMEAVGTLAGGVAHDFNNLLQVVLGYSELILSDEHVPVQYRDDLAKIVQAANNGADLVRGLLTFSRKTEFNPRPINLNRRIEQLQKMLSRTIPKMIRIELILASDLANVNADSIQMEQILMNLSINARDAMPEGGRLIIETENVTLDEYYCRTHFETKPGPYVLLTVSDTGRGMDKETLLHIFEPFFTTKGPAEGTGLGLAMVYGIVKQHGGHVMCYSEESKGTTFRVYFPALVSGPEAPTTTDGAIMRGGSETILLVDDEDLIRELGRRIMEKAGYRVITAANGKEALEVYQTHRDEIALVILDLIMPQMGGAQCLRELLRINPRVKVAISSGFAADAQAKAGLESGAGGFVKKPFNMQEILGNVRKLLDAD